MNRDHGRDAAVVGLVAAAVAALVLTLWVAMDAGAPGAFDTWLTGVTRGWADDLAWPVELARVIGIVTSPRDGIVVVAAVLALLWWRGAREAARWLALSVALGALLAESVKLLVGRSRPPGAELYETTLQQSFPSGHAMAGIYLYLVLGVVLLRLGRANAIRWLLVVGWLLVAAGPLIGLSRLVLGVHWPSDVLGGWAYGSVVALATALLLWDRLARSWVLEPSAAQAVGEEPR